MSVLDLPAYGYHADLTGDERPSLSASVIHELVSKSPAHARAKHPRLNPAAEVEVKHEWDIGTVAHQLLLEGDSVVEIVEADDWRTKAAREQRDLARQHGRVPLLAKDWQEVQRMTSALREQIDRLGLAPGLFQDGAAEQTLVWEEHGVLCRARLDWLRDDRLAIDDYKTAASASPEKWSRKSVFDHGHDIQAVLYQRAVRAVFGVDPQFRFVVVEKTPPYALAVYQLAPDTVELANRKIDWALNEWRRCLAADEWPAYPRRVCWVTLEPWHEPRWLDREARDAA